MAGPVDRADRRILLAREGALHIVLLGDSILDNGAYTEGGPPVIAQLEGLLASGDRATLLAVDGSTTADVARQVERVPEDATHLVLSAGGNDALLESGVLARPARTTAEGLLHLMAVIARFEQAYRGALDAVLRRRLPTVVCTIYNGRFAAIEQVAITAGVRLFNDSIFQAAFDAGLPVIDLRRVCTDPADYANPIEPSSRGGLKIARAILEVVQGSPRASSYVWPTGLSRPEPGR
jgi:hypothetical protein